MKRRWTMLLEIVLLGGLLIWVAVSLTRWTSGERVHVKVHLQGSQNNATLLREPDGRFTYEITRRDGRVQLFTPAELAERIYTDQRRLTWWMRLLNITGTFELLWVTIGLLGQVLFTGRMLVQWLASEKQQKSVVPPAFWWMSLVGASMLVAYFIWRRDPVGILGQAVGWFIYMRNLWLIYRPNLSRQIPVPDEPGAVKGQ